MGLIIFVCIGVFIGALFGILIPLSAKSLDVITVDSAKTGFWIALVIGSLIGGAGGWYWYVVGSYSP